MIEKFRKLEELAKRWKEYSFKVNGWKSFKYTDGEKIVWCYFSKDTTDDGRLTSVHIGDVRGIGVSFFSSVEFSNLTYHALEHFDNIIKDYSLWLDRLEV